MVEREAKTNEQRSLRNEKLKANRASVTEEQRRERLRIRREKVEQKEQKKLQEEEVEVVSNRRQRESAPGHSQKIEAR